MATEGFTDAIAMLEADHRTVEDLFEQFEKTSDVGKKAALAQEICTELKIHSLLEEEFFYPAFRGKIEDRSLNEAQVEHDGAKVLINDIVSGEPASDSFYEAKVKVLFEEIKHHVKEEEKSSGGVFAQARGAGVDLVALRDSMLARRRELLEQSQSSAGLPAAKPVAVRLS